MSDAAAQSTQTTQQTQAGTAGRTEVVIQRETRDDGPQIPKWRFDEVSQSAAAHKAESERLKAELETERAKSAKVTEAEATAARYRTLHETDTAMLVLAREHEALADEDVRDLFRETYQKQAGRAGDKAPSFADWLKTQGETPSPLLKPYLSKAIPQDGAEAPKVAPKVAPKAPPNVDAGAAAPGTQTRARLSDAELERIFRSEPFTSDLYKQAEAQLRADGKIR